MCSPARFSSGTACGARRELQAGQVSLRVSRLRTSPHLARTQNSLSGAVGLASLPKHNCVQADLVRILRVRSVTVLPTEVVAEGGIARHERWARRWVTASPDGRGRR